MSPTDFSRCNVCDNPGDFASALDVQKVKPNVRRFKDEIFTLWRCSNCRSLHALEAVDLDRYYAEYPFKKQQLNFSTRTALRNRARLLKRHGLKKRHHILDYGCGTGLFLETLRELGYENTAGYDRFVPHFANESVLNATYDVVCSQDVIEHVDEPRQYLADIARLMTPDGLLAVGTPDATDVDLSRYESFQMELHQPYHRHILSREALVRLGEAVGLRLIDMHRRFYFDTLYPTVNTRFIYEYVRRTGNFIDVAVEPPQILPVLTSPTLLFFLFAGYFFPPRSFMVAFFRHRN